jgi:tetratricopeptide (TPR) repeat protein
MNFSFVDENDVNKEKPKIVLNMIVKNESKIICRLLESVYKIIDAYCICDTGSTDNTIQVIEEFFEKINKKNKKMKKKHEIKGQIIKKKFVNFGYNRNWILEKCKLLYDDYDFILLLDADMVVKYSDDFYSNMHELVDLDYYYIMQGSKDFKYRNIRLVKPIQQVKYIGDTHEYLNIPVNFKSKTIKEDEFFINDIGDGSNKDNKFIRDIDILKKSIEKNPNDVRSYFYLANSYFDIGEYQKAIKNYKIRIEKGGWFEEISYSNYRIGLCYLGLKKNEKAVQKFMKAYQINPIRLEPIYEIIKHYRLKKQYSLCNLFFKHAISMNEPPEEALFINTDIYRYKLLYEFYIFYYYLNIIDKSFYDFKEIHDILFKLLNNHCNVDNVLENYKFYCRGIKVNMKLEFLEDTRYDLTGVKDIFNSSNICLFQYNNKVNFIIRYVNYFFDNKWKYVYREKEATKNYLITYKNKENEDDEEYSEIETDVLINEKDRVIKDYDVLLGLQDIRIINFKNKLHYIGNVVFNYKDNSGNNLRGSTIEFGTFDYDNKTLNGTIIKSPKNKMCEKNWALFNTPNKIYCIYKWNPISIGIIKNDELLIRLNLESPEFFKYVCGSTPGIKIDNYFLFICHVVSHSKPRRYYHLFVKIHGGTFKLLDYSYLFTFQGEPIEYCCGMIYKNDLLYITYSVKDNNTKLLTMSLDNICYVN